jgi:hypothetical protein
VPQSDSSWPLTEPNSKIRLAPYEIYATKQQWAVAPARGVGQTTTKQSDMSGYAFLRFIRDTGAATREPVWVAPV